MSNSNHTPIERYGLVAIGLFLMAQAVAAVIWGTKLETRVEIIEKRGSPTVDAVSQKILLLEERQRITSEQLQKANDKIDSLIDGLRSQIPTTTNRPGGRQ